MPVLGKNARSRNCFQPAQHPSSASLSRVPGGAPSAPPSSNTTRSRVDLARGQRFLSLALGQHGAESNGLCVEAVETEAQRATVTTRLWTSGDLSASPSLGFVFRTIGQRLPYRYAAPAPPAQGSEYGRCSTDAPLLPPSYAILRRTCRQ